MERVLLVDDETDALEILSWMLTDQGHQVRTAVDLEQAVTIAGEFRPTLLITDYLLCEESTGLDVIRRARELDADLPAVLITGMDVGQLRHECEAMGNVRVLRKPFGWSELRQQLQA